MYKIGTVMQALIAVLALIGSFITMTCSFINESNTVWQVGSVVIFLLVGLLNYLVINEMLKGE